MDIPKRVPDKPSQRKGWRRVTDRVDIQAATLSQQAAAASTIGAGSTRDDSTEPITPQPITSTNPEWKKTFLVPTVEILPNGVMQLEEGRESFPPIPLSDQWMVFGSDPVQSIQVGACAVIRHPSISRAHCAMTFHHGRLFIYDLGSTNRTWLIKAKNFVETDGVTLVEDGDLIALGQVVLQIVVHEKVL